MTSEQSATADPPDSRSTDGSGTPHVRTRVRRRRRRSRVVLGLLLVVLVVGTALVFLLRPLVSAKHESQAAQRDLTAAKAALERDHIGQARDYVRLARGHVEQAQRDANGLGGDVWSAVPVAGGAVDDERHLIDALDQATSVAELGVRIYPIVSGGSAELVRGQRIDLKLLQTVADRTTAIGPHLDQALKDLDQVSGSTPIVGRSVLDAKQTALGYLSPVRDTYRANAPIIRSLPRLVGADGPRTYLLAMLNPAELRYSGGGALSFTTMRFANGVATFGRSMNVDDVLAHGNVQRWTPVAGNTFHRAPPQRVTASTFSPWWSVSGEELLRGYRQAVPGPALSGLVAIDLQGLAALFGITGPVDLPSFGEITAGNLVHTLAGSYGDFDSVEQRRRLNAELVPAFRQQFFAGGQMSEKVKSLAASARGRHFFLYFRNPAVRRRFARAGLSGDLSGTPYDYLGVFSQNLNGSKTDYWQHREVTSTVHLRPDGGARVHLHVAVTNQAPAYDLPGPDPGTGYSTRFLGTRIGVFMPRHTTFGSARLDGQPVDSRVHLPTVADVRNRKYVEGQFLLDSGQTGTYDVSYRVQHAAEVVDAQSMTYRLDVDPQDLVSPELLHVTVTWPDGYLPSGGLPAGWTSTAHGATFDGAVTTRAAWEIPLSRG